MRSSFEDREDVAADSRSGRKAFPHLPVLPISMRFILVPRWTYGVAQMVLLGALLLIPLNNAELGGILWVMHDMPVEGLLSAQVDGGALGKRGTELHVPLCPDDIPRRLLRALP